MRENNLIALTLLGVIIGASGLGFGAYSTMQVQTGAVKGDDGDDGDDGTDGKDVIIEPTNVYYCSSGSEIQSAIDAIGNGSGTIFIMDNFELTTGINIDGGGTYVIQGSGSIIEVTQDVSVYISSAALCTIKDLIINVTYVNYNPDRWIIWVEELESNPINIENIKIFTKLDYGKGVGMRSDNILVSNCYFHGNRIGVDIYPGVNNGYIYGSRFINCSSSGIFCNADNIIIESNIMNIDNANAAIEGHGDNVIIENNIITSNDADGIFCTGDNIIMENNIINCYDGNGIICSGGEYKIMEGNLIDANYYGIFCLDAHSNIISDNNLYNNYQGIYLISSENSTITGNVIDGGYITSPGGTYGIYLYSFSSYNVITSNRVYNHRSSMGNGYGISIVSNADENTVIGNTALNNDYNWLNSSPTTFGNETLNNFA